MKSTCQGCSKKIEKGEVVSFGNYIFHNKCFTCAKCEKRIDKKANLLLSNDGKPICEDCSYNCASCKKSIENEAILTGSQAFHYDCFQCTGCQELIKDLIFTETQKGIFCSNCHNKSEDQDLSILNGSTNNQQSNTLFSDLTSTLSFFNDNDTNLQNLTDSLGENLTIKNQETSHITQSRLNRASAILENTLRKTTSIIFTSSATSDSDTTKLKQELDDLKSKYKELDASHQSLKEASQEALNEFNKIKQDHSNEINLKKQLEYTIITLLTKDNKKEVDQASRFKIDLENTCKQLIDFKDKITKSIDEKLILSDYPESLKLQINSLTQERDLLTVQTQSLRSTRDEIISDMVILNTKNAELTSMNNDLSRRVIEKEKKVTSPPLSPSESTETRRNRKHSDASSLLSISDQSMKKKKSSMFSKFTSKRVEPSNLFRTTTQQPSIYQHSNLSVYKNSLHSTSSTSLANPDCQHAFQSASFIKPTKCGICRDKIWARSEYRCDHCGFAAHSRCLHKTSYGALIENATSSSLDLPTISIEHIHPSTSTSTVKSSDNSIYHKDKSMRLSERCVYERRQVPLIVEECLKEVELRGLDYEGLYRKSGGAAQTKAILVAFENGNDIDLHDEDVFNDICAITSALKQYFRELPNPLLTFELYDTLIELSVLNNDEKKLQFFKTVISQLPKAHYDTASLLFRHLDKIQACSNLNRMTVKNLAMVFAPTLMRHSDPSKDFLDISYKNATIEYILLHTAHIFPSL